MILKIIDILHLFLLYSQPTEIINWEGGYLLVVGTTCFLQNKEFAQVILKITANMHLPTSPEYVTEKFIKLIRGKIDGGSCKLSFLLHKNGVKFSL